MIGVRRAAERGRGAASQGQSWSTFTTGVLGDRFAAGFGALESLDEDRLAPGAAGHQEPRADIELLTFVHEGALAYRDSAGRSGVIQAGEFQHRSVGPCVHHRESNACRSSWTHVFRLSLRAGPVGLAASEAHQRFSAAERRCGLCVVASQDGRRGSLRVRRDVALFSALLRPGQHVVHALGQDRSVWLHLVAGEITCHGVVLVAGDGAGLWGERAVSLTARGEAEILLLELGDDRDPPATEVPR